MDRRSVITSLKTLRMELEDCQVDLVADMPEATLMLVDVCSALGLSEAEMAEVLGKEVAEAIEEWTGARLWQLAKMETATIPPVELAAVPV